MWQRPVVSVRGVGLVVLPASPDDLGPGSCEDALGVWAPLPVSTLLLVAVSCPSLALRESPRYPRSTFCSRMLDEYRKVTARCRQDARADEATPARQAREVSPGNRVRQSQSRSARSQSGWFHNAGTRSAATGKCWPRYEQRAAQPGVLRAA